jgi:hypothetical protein
MDATYTGCIEAAGAGKFTLAHAVAATDAMGANSMKEPSTKKEMAMDTIGRGWYWCQRLVSRGASRRRHSSCWLQDHAPNEVQPCLQGDENCLRALRPACAS